MAYGKNETRIHHSRDGATSYQLLSRIAACGFCECQLGTNPASCVVMTGHRLLLVLMTALIVVSNLTYAAHAQPATAPPSSLPSMPLMPNKSDPTGVASCDLCRPLAGRSGSDLERHRPRRDKSLHPHKNARGIHRSPKRMPHSTLPRRRLVPNEGSDQHDPQTCR